MRRTSLTDLSSKFVNYLISKRGLTVSRIAKIAGVDKSFISRAKSAERELSVGHFEKLAEHFNVELGVLLLDMGKPPKTKDPMKLKLIAMCDEFIRKADAFTAKLKEKRKSKAA